MRWGGTPQLAPAQVIERGVPCRSQARCWMAAGCMRPACCFANVASPRVHVCCARSSILKRAENLTRKRFELIVNPVYSITHQKRLYHTPTSLSRIVRANHSMLRRKKVDMGPKPVQKAACAHSKTHHPSTSDAILEPPTHIHAPKLLRIGAKGTLGVQERPR